MKCEIEQLYPGELCENTPVANITVSGDQGSITIGVCLDHLSKLTKQMPTNLGPEAKQQVKSWRRLRTVQ